MNRRLILSLVAAAGLAVGLLAGAGFASQTLTVSPVAGHSTPKAEPSESPDPTETPEPAETPEAGDSSAPENGGSGTTAHPCNHGFYVSQAAHAHKGGQYVSSIAQSDLGKNGDCSAPLPTPKP